MADPMIINGSDVQQLLDLEQAQATYQVAMSSDLYTIKIVLILVAIIAIISLIRNLRRNR